MTHALNSHRLLFFLSLAAMTSLSGCILVVDGVDDDSGIPNGIPYIVEDDTYWNCALDDVVGVYFWEFQAGVGDADGLADVESVLVDVVLADSGFLLESVNLIDEGAGIWGGLVWEDESELYCGDAVDVTFTVYDFWGDSDSFTLYY